MAFELPRDVEEHIDLLHPGVALHHPLHHPQKPARALAAGRALAASLVHVEMRQEGDRVYDVGRLVLHDDAGGYAAGPHLPVAADIHHTRYTAYPQPV